MLRLILNYLNKEETLNILNSLNFYNYENLLDILTDGKIVLINDNPIYKTDIKTEKTNNSLVIL